VGAQDRLAKCARQSLIFPSALHSLVGYPARQKKEYQALFDFVNEIRFDRVGAFQFSFEAGDNLRAARRPCAWSVKQERYERLMELQHKISRFK